MILICAGCGRELEYEEMGEDEIEVLPCDCVLFTYNVSEEENDE